MSSSRVPYEFVLAITSGILSTALRAEPPQVSEPPSTSIPVPVEARTVPVHPARITPRPGPRVAVADAIAADILGTATLVGGFTDRLEATAAIQVRDPRRGWLPIGNALLEPRAEATGVLLDDGSLLVVGGWSGVLPDRRRWLGTAERCDPRRPERRRPLPPPWPDRLAEGLEGVAGCRLADGRAVLVHEGDVVVFDPTRDRWSSPKTALHPRRHATLLSLGPDSDGNSRILVVGGAVDPTAPAIETVTIDPDGTLVVDAWSGLGPPPVLRRAAAVRSGTDVFIAGGDDGRDSTRLVWRLDPDSRTSTPASEIPIAGGLTRATLLARGERLLLVGGETLRDGRPTAPSCGHLLDPRRGRTWRVPDWPATAIRAAVIPRSSDAVELVGGYRFDGPNGRRRATVLGTDLELTLPGLVASD